MSALYFFEDIGCAGSPNQRFGIRIVNFQILFDGGNEIRLGMKNAAANLVGS